MDGARVTLRTDAELERPPGDAKRAVGVSHAESWRRNIYASEPAHYNFLQWTTFYLLPKIPALGRLRSIISSNGSDELSCK